MWDFLTLSLFFLLTDFPRPINHTDEKNNRLCLLKTIYSFCCPFSFSCLNTRSFLHLSMLARRVLPLVFCFIFFWFCAGIDDGFYTYVSFSKSLIIKKNIRSQWITRCLPSFYFYQSTDYTDIPTKTHKMPMILLDRTNITHYPPGNSFPNPNIKFITSDLRQCQPLDGFPSPPPPLSPDSSTWNSL